MKKNLKKQVMEKINKGEVKKRSHLFFKLIKAVALATLIFLGIISTYSFNLMFYLPKRANFAPPLPEQRLIHILSIVPWPILFTGGIALAGMIYLYRKYEGGYKVQLKWVIIIASIITIVSGYTVYASSLNERLDKRPGIRKFHDYSEQEFIPKGKRLRRLELQGPEVRGRFHESR